MDGYKQMAMVMKAMGHPIRLQILDVLDLEGESCVCHLEHRLGQRQAYISQQLARLREAGLVRDRREGLNVFYALADASIAELLKMVRKMMTDDAQAGDEPRRLLTPSRKRAEPCPCPKCEEREKVERGDANLNRQPSEGISC